MIFDLHYFLPSFLSFFLSSFLLLIPHLICINQLLPINYHPPIIPQPIFINQMSPTNHQPIVINQISQSIMIFWPIIFSSGWDVRPGAGCHSWVRRCSAVICVRGVQKYSGLQGCVGVEDPQFARDTSCFGAPTSIFRYRHYFISKCNFCGRCYPLDIIIIIGEFRFHDRFNAS